MGGGRGVVTGKCINVAGILIIVKIILKEGGDR